MNRKMMKRPPALLLAVLIFLSGCSGFANKGDDSLSINDDLASTVDQMLSEGEGGDIDNADGIDGANSASSPAPVNYAEFSPERGDLAECGLSEEGFSLINDIIENDLSHGGTSAQLAVIKDRKLVYENAWGKLNSYEKDGLMNATVKADPSWRDFYRDLYPAVTAAYHMNKEHWIAVILDGTVSENEIYPVIDEAYALVSKKNKN